MNATPLSGLRVIEFSAFVAAPSAGLALAQLGADVIRIDPLGGNIDIDRAPLGPQGRSLYWASLNRGKRSVEVNVRSAEGRALLQRLIIAPGDGPAVFLTNLSVDGELSYAALAKARPDVIMVQLTGSPDGSAAVDYTVNCAAGFPGITGSGHDGPVNHVLPAWDLIAGQMLALSVLAAERHWRLTGQGQHVKLALSDVAMATVANLGYLADVELNGTQRRADGNFLYGAYGDSFACADGRHAMVVAITERQWAARHRPERRATQGGRSAGAPAGQRGGSLCRARTDLHRAASVVPAAHAGRGGGRLHRPLAAVGALSQLRADAGRRPALLRSQPDVPPYRTPRRRSFPHRHGTDELRCAGAIHTRAGADAGPAHTAGAAAAAGPGRRGAGCAARRRHPLGTSTCAMTTTNA
jgi:hypothetical protein